MLVRLIETEKSGRFVNALILEADDGATAIEMVRSAQESGEGFDYILMDYIMVSDECLCDFMYVSVDQ